MPTLVVGFSPGGRIWIFFGIAPEYRNAVMVVVDVEPSVDYTALSSYAFVMLADA